MFITYFFIYLICYPLALLPLPVLYLLAVAYRAIRTYMVSLESVLYLVLYVATLEVLPMALLIYLSAKTITIL